MLILIRLKSLFGSRILLYNSANNKLWSVIKYKHFFFFFIKSLLFEIIQFMTIEVLDMT